MWGRTRQWAKRIAQVIGLLTISCFAANASEPLGTPSSHTVAIGFGEVEIVVPSEVAVKPSDSYLEALGYSASKGGKVLLHIYLGNSWWRSGYNYAVSLNGLAGSQSAHQGLSPDRTVILFLPRGRSYCRYRELVFYYKHLRPSESRIADAIIASARNPGNCLSADLIVK